MNFNITRKKKDYNLNGNMIDEVISLYGISTKILLTEKINSDDLVFGDYSHLKTDSTKSFEVYALPEVTESWDNMGINFSEFGMLNVETINLFFSKKTVESIFDITTNGMGSPIGNLIVLPNNRIVEITDWQFEVPGGSNLFVHNDVKNAYKATCKTYDNKLIQELSSTNITPASDVSDASVDYNTLDNYFNELTNEANTVDTEAEVNVQTDTGKPIIATDEDSVFGNF